MLKNVLVFVLPRATSPITSESKQTLEIFDQILSQPFTINIILRAASHGILAVRNLQQGVGHWVTRRLQRLSEHCLPVLAARARHGLEEISLGVAGAGVIKVGGEALLIVVTL